MADFDYLQERRASVWSQSGIKRISWSAIFAGSVIAICSQLLLTLLGMGIGFVSLSPTEGSIGSQAAGLGVGGLIWWSISMLLSLFAGGWVAGRMSGVPRAGDGFLHGVLSWGVVTMASVFLLTTAVGATLGGLGSLIGKTMDVGAETAKAAPEGSKQQAAQALDPENVKQEARQLAANIEERFERVTGDPNRQQQAKQTAEKAATATGAGAIGTFIALALGALSGGYGGRAGAAKILSPRPIPSIRRDSREEAIR